MGYYERIDARGVRETGRPVSFVPKGALTHHPRSGRWYCLRQPCALRGGCGSCGSLVANASSRLCCCHWPRSRLFCFVCKMMVWVKVTQTTHAVCLRKSATGSFVAVMGIACRNTHFLFAKKKQKRERRDGENKWRFTTWKQR